MKLVEQIIKLKEEISASEATNNYDSLKYGGFLSVKASKEDSIRIGQLLGYTQSDINSYIKKNYEWNPPEYVDSVFENVKRLKKLMNISEDLLDDMQANLQNLAPQFAQVAQSIYNEWEQDEEGIDDIYGGGGICDDIAEKMCEVVHNNTLYGAFHLYSKADCHTSIYVYYTKTKECYNVDINPFHYETGTAYTWTKLPDVRFQPNMVEVTQVDYHQYIDDDGSPKEFY